MPIGVGMDFRLGGGGGGGDFSSAKKVSGLDWKQRTVFLWGLDIGCTATREVALLYIL